MCLSLFLPATAATGRSITLTPPVTQPQANLKYPGGRSWSAWRMICSMSPFAATISRKHSRRMSRSFDLTTQTMNTTCSMRQRNVLVSFMSSSKVMSRAGPSRRYSNIKSLAWNMYFDEANRLI